MPLNPHLHEALISRPWILLLWLDGLRLPTLADWTPLIHSNTSNWPFILFPLVCQAYPTVVSTSKRAWARPELACPSPQTPSHMAIPLHHRMSESRSPPLAPTWLRKPANRALSGGSRESLVVGRADRESQIRVRLGLASVYITQVGRSVVSCLSQPEVSRGWFLFQACLNPAVSLKRKLSIIGCRPHLFSCVLLLLVSFHLSGLGVEP